MPPHSLGRLLPFCELMSHTTNLFDERMAAYLREVSQARESEVLARCRERTAKLPDGRMQISVEQGRLMAVLAQMLGVRRAVEVGVFTGYSSLCIAEVLPADGLLVACDLSEEWTDIAREYWQQARVEDRIDLRLGPASETLAAMIDAGEAGTYDFAFIDADKISYDEYYEQCLRLLRPGGALTIDNMFLHGRVVEPQEDYARAVRRLTEKIFTDDRVAPALIPIGDGLLLARKR